MPVRRFRQLRSEEGGFALVEVLISALIVVMITAAVVQTLTATGRASTEERHRAQAFSVAQEDQARLRSIQISTLQQGLEPRTVIVDGTPFTVTSTAKYISDKTGATECGGEGKADYVQIGSSVTWPTMHEGQAPITIESILSPTSGSVESASGGLAVSILNSRDKQVGKNGIAGVPLAGKGPATFFGTTNYKGCALFGGEPVGHYTITPTLPGSDYVNPKGERPKALEVDVAGGLTTPLEEHYDHEGKIEASFFYMTAKGVKVEAKADSMVAFNPLISAKVFGTPETERVKKILAGSLYPFESSYSIWGGSCAQTEAALQPEAAAQTPTIVPVGGTIKEEIQLPALYLTVKNTSVPAEKTASGGAKVTMTDLHCEGPSEKDIVRRYKTTALGTLGDPATGVTEEPGMPTGEYLICVSKGGRRVEKTVMVKELPGVPLTIDLAESKPKSKEC